MYSYLLLTNKPDSAVYNVLQHTVLHEWCAPFFCDFDNGRPQNCDDDFFLNIINIDIEIWSTQSTE